MIYQTDNTPGFYYNSGSSASPVWVMSGTGSWWGLTGNSGTSAGTNFIGTSDNVAFSIRVNNQPSGKIDHLLFNTSIGYLSLGSNTTGNSSTALGHQSLFSNRANNRTTAIGYNAMYYTDDRTTARSTFNTAVGYEALKGSTTASANTDRYNTAVGDQALFKMTTGEGNVGIGYVALYTNNTGIYNFGAGYGVLYNNTTGSNNTALGLNPLYANTTGSNNIAIGTRALRKNTDRSFLIAIGDSALFNNGTDVVYDYQAIANTAVGIKALYSNTTGYYNPAAGYKTLFYNISGYHNTAGGYFSLYNNTSGNSNTAVGLSSLLNNVNGNNNTAIGKYSSYYSDDDYNTSVGYSSGDYHTFSSGTFLGVSAYPNAEGYSNCMALGYNARTTASNRAVIGNTSVTSIGGYANWSNFSDGRFKKNVREAVPGLEFISQLRPVLYTLDITSLNADLDKNKPSVLREGEQPRVVSQQDLAGIASKERMVYTGFIAQEVEQAAKKIGFDFSGIDAPKNPDDYYGLRYAEFVVPLVKAVQELNRQNDELKLSNKEMLEMIGQLRNRIEKLEGNK